mgnify:FL=1
MGGHNYKDCDGCNGLKAKLKEADLKIDCLLYQMNEATHKLEIKLEQADSQALALRETLDPLCKEGSCYCWDLEGGERCAPCIVKEALVLPEPQPELRRKYCAVNTDARHWCSCGTGPTPHSGPCHDACPCWGDPAPSPAQEPPKLCEGIKHGLRCSPCVAAGRECSSVHQTDCAKAKEKKP